MHFQNPLFLWALLLLAVPVLIHLFNFRRYKQVMFSNVEMLKQIQTESRKTKQVKKWLILASRLLALACLILAFALPYLPSGNLVAGRNLVSIYVDNSYSMYGDGQNGQLFENAKNIGRDILQNLPQDAEIQIINNNLSPFTHKIFTKMEAEKLIDDLEISAHPNSLNTIIQTASQLAKSNSFASNQLFLLSDFQKQNQEVVSISDSSMQIYGAMLAHQSKSNVSVDSVWLNSPVNKMGEPILLKIWVTNNGDEKVPSTTLELNVNGVQQGVETFNLGPNEKKTLSLSFSSQEEWNNGSVVINDVPITFDNKYYFTVSQKSAIEVLVIGESSAAIQKVFQGDETFNFNQVSAASVNYGELNKYNLVILNELKTVSSGLTNQLSTMLKEGSNVVVIPSAQKPDYASLQSTLGLATYGRLTKKSLSISSNNLNHPFWNGVYRTRPKNALMPKIEKQYQMNAASSILSLKDGSAVLAAKRYGNGSVYQWALPLDKSFSTITDNELFVNALLQMAFSNTVTQQIAYPLHYSAPIALNETTSNNAVLSLVKGSSSTIVETSNAAGKQKYWLNNEIEEEGHYNLVTQDEERVSQLALNNNRSESKQEFYEADEFQQALGGVNFTEINDSIASIKDSTEQSSKGRPLWKLFIILSLIFLLIEILLLRFLKS
jgi:hypothetical protein